MGDSDDGIQLNLTPYEFKPKQHKQQQQHTEQQQQQQKQVKENDRPNQNKHHRELKQKSSKGLEKQNKPLKKSHSANGKREYIDPKDFVPVSNLFNKKPEIPEVTNEPVVSEKSEQVLFTTENVADLQIGEKLKSNLQHQSNFTALTRIQQLSLPMLLNGKDAMIRSPTGSGKTMCYAVPIVDALSKKDPSVSREHGPYVIVLVPTRELALQTLNVFQDLCKCCISIVPGMLIGGEKCKAEKARLRKGVNVLVATPGRLIYHMKETACLDLSHIKFLVLDEADHLLDLGFRKTIGEVIDIVNSKSKVERQSVLLSATLNENVKDLVALSLKEPVFIDAAENENKITEKKKSEKNEETKGEDSSGQDYETPCSLTQHFVVVPAKLRLISLVVFVMSKVIPPNTGKVIVFASSKNSVIFLFDAFKLAVKSCEEFAGSDYNAFSLHGDMSQQDRFKSFEKFKRSTSGVLFCTDVASRGLDIKSIDWVVHYDCPTQTDDYLHRTGRTARIGNEGNSLLFLLPSETKYINVLNQATITLTEIKLSNILKFLTDGKKTRRVEERAQSIQNSMEESIGESKELHEKAVAAYKAYIQGYATYPKHMKHIFHVKLLHLGHVAKSFGMRKAPVNAIAAVQNTLVVGKKRKMKMSAESNKEKMKRRKVDDIGEVLCGPRTKKMSQEMKKKKTKKRSIMVR